MNSRRSEIIIIAKCPCQKCKAGPYIPISDLLINLIIKLEKKIGEQAVITSGNRCEEYNRLIGGYWDSPHIPKPEGEAADIKVPGMSMVKLAYACEEVGFKRIGIYPGHVHTDVIEPRPSKFWYLKSYKSRTVYSGNKKTLKSFLKYLKKEGGLRKNDMDLVD